MDQLERLRRAGFAQFELHASPEFDYRNRSLLRDIARWFGENELPPPSLHLPFEDNALSEDAAERQHAMDEIKRCLELNDLLPASYAVLHLGVHGQQFHPVHFEYAYAAVSAVSSFSGLRVLIETLPNEIATPRRIREFQAAAQLPDLGICYDTGHRQMDGQADDAMDEIDETTDAIHLNDNLGEDDHLWPFEGHRNWPAFAENIVVASFKGPMILEGSDENFGKARDSQSRLQDLIDEAAHSLEEFRLKYKLASPKMAQDR